MDAAPVNTIERILSRRSLVRGHARIATVWSIVAVILLLLLLFDLNLILGILIDRGRIDVTLDPKDFARFEQLTQPSLTQGVNLQAPVADERQNQIASIKFSSDGILPAVWQTRDVWWEVPWHSSSVAWVGCSPTFWD